MTQDQTTDDESVDPTLPLSVAEWNSFPDQTLAIIVDAVNKTENVAIPITLYASGLIISGMLISSGEFYDRLGQSFRDNDSAEFAENFADFMARLVREQANQETEEGLPQQLTNPICIHLREAQVFTSSAEMPFPGTLWRGRLSTISGWSFGQLMARRA